MLGVMMRREVRVRECVGVSCGGDEKRDVGVCWCQLWW